MTAEQLIQGLLDLIKGGMPPNVEVRAYDAEVENDMPITGMVYDSKTLVFQTDDID